MTAGSLDSFTYMTDDAGECINQENSVLHEVWCIQYTAGKNLQQQELEKQKKQSEALNEITQEIGKCEEHFVNKRKRCWG